MAKLQACKQADCKVREDGKCLEGIEPLTDCTHFYLDSRFDESGLESETNPAIEQLDMNKFKLFSGQELTMEQITVVTNRYPCQLIMILGDQECGKTTLLAAIYDLFQINAYLEEKR